jgi:IS5 family transposase
MYGILRSDPGLKCTIIVDTPSKTVHFHTEIRGMYKPQDRKTQILFPELFPFGGSLDRRNRWLRIRELIPWDELEFEYLKYFSDIGRPAKDAQLILGLLLLKHMTKLSDREIIAEVMENPYMQAFCGFHSMATAATIDSSTLTQARKRLGPKFFRHLEKTTYAVLIERGIIRARGLLADATVFPEEIKFPTDVGLLNDVRRWLVGTIKRLGGKVRTYRRKADKEYLRFSKTKRKTKKIIGRAKKAMLQYVRRNIRQLETLLQKPLKVETKILEWLAVSKAIFRQQREMYRTRANRISGRIVSLYRPYVRPIKTGKYGKETEFGARGALTHVDGFLFLDYWKHEAFNESGHVARHMEAYRERFGKLPPYFVGDTKYGTRTNRADLETLGVRPSFKALGRRAARPKPDRWFKKKQKERNRIEGAFGHGKEHFGLSRVRYKGEETSEVWVRASLLAMNLRTALKRA